MHTSKEPTANISNQPDYRTSWSKLRSRQWTARFRTSSDPKEAKTQEYIISTDPDLIPIKTVMEAFDQEFFYWGNALPEEQMQLMIQSSLCFGLYTKEPELSLVGFARLVTDCVTVGYFTDFYVLPRYQGTGLGTWLLRCIEEVTDQWPHLRRIMFFTNSERSRRYYEKVFASRALGAEGETFFMERPGPARPTPSARQPVVSGLEQTQ